MGLDLEQLQTQDSGIRIERVVRFTSYRAALKDGKSPDSVWLCRQFMLNGEGYEGCYEPFIKEDNIAAAIYNGYFEGKVIETGISLTSNWGLERNWHAAAITPGHQYFMENYMLLMTHLDPLHIGNGGLTIGTVGHEEQIQGFAKAYCALPAENF